MISPRAFTEQAVSKYRADVAGISWLRSVITPPRHTNARSVLKSGATEIPVITPAVIDPDPKAMTVAVERSQILHPTDLGPPECVTGSVARDIGAPDHLTIVVDGVRNMTQDLARAAEISEVDHAARFPQQRVQRLQMLPGIRD